MFDIKRDLAIYKSSVHSEWETAISKLKTENGAYLVKFRIKLDLVASVFKLKFVPVMLGLSEASLAAKIITIVEPYYASELLRFMTANPKVSGETLAEGGEFVFKISKTDVDDKMLAIAPATHMKRVFQAIINECLNHNANSAGKRNKIFLMHALFGLDVKLNTTNLEIKTILRGVLFTDFGFRDVQHIEALLTLVQPFKRGAIALLKHDLMNQIDELLALHGRPVVRPTPSSIYMRKILRNVKTSPIFEKFEVIKETQLSEPIPF